MFGKQSASESIQRRFRHIVAAIYGVVLLLLLVLIAEQWIGYRDAREALREFDVLQTALRTMSAVSDERVPMFLLLGGADNRAGLQAARRTTDASLEALKASINDPRCKACDPSSAPLAQMAQVLNEARHELDAIAETPPESRVPENTVRAFERMVSVIPQLATIADASAMGVVRENADVQNYLLAARLAARLREHAGRVAVELVPALKTHRALTPDETFEIGQTLGKIEQLRVLITPTLRGMPYSLRADFAQLDQGYLREGIAYIEQLTSLASHPEGTDVSPMQLSEHYSPHIEFVKRFRDEALSLANDTIRESLRWHLILLIATATFALALSIVLEFMILRFRRRIVRPFVEARGLILSIASGDLSVAIPEHRYVGEVNELFSSLAVLKNISEEKVRLEQERKRLIGELKVMAETDPLTGLLNRRAFESRATALLSDQRGGDACAALIMLDIDHFKKVNDTYGHETGDRALVKLARLCRETFRIDDVVGRLGGEEFAVLLRVKTPEQALVLAERLRERLHRETVVATSGEVFGFTVSFGVASAPMAESPAIADLLREADALLYQAKANGRDRIEQSANA